MINKDLITHSYWNIDCPSLTHVGVEWGEIEEDTCMREQLVCEYLVKV